MGHESILRATRRVAHTGMFTPDAIRVAGLPERTVRRILGLPPVNASVGRGRKPRIRPILNADGERIGQTHIRGAFPGLTRWSQISSSSGVGVWASLQCGHRMRTRRWAMMPSTVALSR